MFIMTLLLMPERPTPVPNENQELILLQQDCCLLRKRGEAGAQPVWPDWEKKEAEISGFYKVRQLFSPCVCFYGGISSFYVFSMWPLWTTPVIKRDFLKLTAAFALTRSCASCGGQSMSDIPGRAFFSVLYYPYAHVHCKLCRKWNLKFSVQNIPKGTVVTAWAFYDSRLWPCPEIW